MNLTFGIFSTNKLAVFFSEHNNNKPMVLSTFHSLAIIEKGLTFINILVGK